MPTSGKCPVLHDHDRCSCRVKLSKPCELYAARLCACRRRYGHTLMKPWIRTCCCSFASVAHASRQCPHLPNQRHQNEGSHQTTAAHKSYDMAKLISVGLFAAILFSFDPGLFSFSRRPIKMARMLSVKLVFGSASLCLGQIHLAACSPERGAHAHRVERHEVTVQIARRRKMERTVCAGALGRRRLLSGHVLTPVVRQAALRPKPCGEEMRV